MSKKLTVYKKSKINKRLSYIEALLVFSLIPLFLTAHYLLTIHYYSNWDTVDWFGLKIDSIIFVDFVLYSAIFLTVILFILILHRNFMIRGKR